MVLTGTGKAFSPAGDVELFARSARRGREVMGLAIGLHALIATLRRRAETGRRGGQRRGRRGRVLDGAGLRRRRGRLVRPLHLGYRTSGSPPTGMTFFLARAVGAQRAMEMTLFRGSSGGPGRRVGTWWQEIFPDAEFAAGVDALASGSPPAPRSLRRAKSCTTGAFPTPGGAARGGAAEHLPVRGSRISGRGSGLPGQAARALRRSITERLGAPVAEAVILLGC